ncbi:MAG: sulfite exporter TauE/SafE family protein [Acidobacteriota bacterium]
MSLQYWFMLPVSVLVATVAMASGVEGATFFTPLFVLALGLPVEVAVGTGLITEFFGFASGLYAYYRKRLIDYRLGGQLLLVTVPMALVGTWLSARIEPDILKVILGMGLLAVAASFLRTPESKDVARMDDAIAEEFGGERAETCLITAAGEEIRYKVCNRGEGGLISGVGAVFMGMISTGLGELNAYFLLQRCRVPSSVSVATSVLVVAFTALTAASGHLYQFIQVGGETLDTVLSLIVFTVPGVIVGGQLGSAVASLVSQTVLERSLGVLFLVIAALMIGQVIIA